MPDNDLDTQLQTLATSLDSFNVSSEELDRLRETYDDPREMPEVEEVRYKTYKRRIIDFNQRLRDVIRSSASKLKFDDLLEYMTGSFAKHHSKAATNEFSERARTTIVGMRNEVALQQVLDEAHVPYQQATQLQDAHGGDIVIDGVPIDIKSSRFAVMRAKQRARRAHHDTRTIVWSHIEPEDFRGQLKLPERAVSPLWRELRLDLQRAVRARQGHQRSS